MIEVKTYEEFCEGFSGDEQHQRVSKILFMLRKNFSVLNRLDSFGNGFVSFDELINDWSRADISPQDYLGSAVQKISAVFSQLAENLRSRILRENVLTPLHKVNELNGQSIVWLSKRSGRTVREKLSGTKSILAVRRRMSFDTGENRLLKEFARRLEDAIFLKNSSLPAELLNADEKILSEKLLRFRHGTEAQEISPWNNLPPNNTLLEDRAYNSVWRAWNDFQKINDLIADDCRNVDERLCSLAKIFLFRIAGERFDFVQLPLIYDAEREDNRQYRLQFLREKIFALNPANKKLLTITPHETEIALEYDGQKVRLKFSDLQATIFADSWRQLFTQEITAENFPFLLTRTLQNLMNEEFLPLKTKTPVPDLKGKSAVADVFSLCPEFCLDGEQVRLSQALLLEKLIERGKVFVTDCFSSRVLPLPEKFSVTLHTFSGIVSEAQNPELLQPLAARLRKVLHADNFVSICPDSFSEFELADFRKTLKLYFHGVRTVSKSLAAIFTCVEKNLLPNEFTAGDWILILDRTADGFSITPIKSRRDDIALTELPEQRGLVWEHHPARIIDADFFDGLALSDAAKDFLSVMSAKDFVRLTERVSFVDRDGNLKDFSSDVRKLKSFRLPIKYSLQKYLAEREKFFGGQKVWLMTLSDELDCDDFNRIDLSNTFLLGGVDFFEASRIRTRVPLWRDCLPDLSIKRLYGTFDLVKDSNFEYGGKTEMLIPIPGGRNFILPSGQKSYRFTLHMSDGSEKNFYAAVVKHKNFPLKTDVECRLVMKFTYGEDNPYSLKFVPLSPKVAGFNEAIVHWERLERFPSENLEYPKYPPAKSWDMLRVLKRKFEAGTEDILAKSLSKLHELTEQSPRFAVNADCHVKKGKATYTRTTYDGQDAVLFTVNETFSPQDKFIYGWAVPSDKDERFCIDASGANWFQNSRKNYQLNMPISIDGRNYTLVFFDSSFFFPNEFNTNVRRLNCTLPRKSDGSLDATNRGFIYAKNILVDKGEPIRFFRVNEPSTTQPTYNLYRFDKWMGALLFGLHEIYFNGRSSSDPTCPPEVAESLRDGLAKMYEMYKVSSGETRNKVSNILCVAAKDVDADFYRDVEDYIFKCAHTNKTARYEVGFLFGDFSEPRQKVLFERCRMLDEKNLICMLAKAIWRNENFIKNFPRDLTKKYFKAAIDLICDNTLLANGKFRVTKPEKIFAMEFVMAVFRLRELADAELDEYLSLNNPLLRRLRSTIENFITAETFGTANTRIELKINQSVEFAEYNIPNLFYALLIYITGESGESDIIIAGVAN